MKPSLILIAGIFTLSACNSTPDSNSEIKREIVADTSSQYNSSTFTDTATLAPEMTSPAIEAKAKERKPVEKSVAKPAPVKSTEAPVITEPVVTPATTTEPTAAVPEPEAAPEEKKGWSNSAKGAVIGAGAGAVGGAIISKKKGKGAIIGGVLGAAGGYIIGKHKDKKDTIK